MRAIKKIEVTPMDLNIGKIINSDATTDDKTKNTYSMQVINNKIDTVNQNAENTYAKHSDFVIVEKKVTIDAQSGKTFTIPYPEGFDADNCFVAGIKSTRAGASFKWNDTNVDLIDLQIQSIWYQDEYIWFSVYSEALLQVENTLRILLVRSIENFYD